MWSLLILLGAVLSVDCYYTTRERLQHGRRLSIRLPKETDRLEFRPSDSTGLETIWSRGQLRPSKGRLTGSSSSSSSSDRHWELQTVVFDDEGTYILMDHWNKETKSILLAVTTANKYINRVAGENLLISLEGSKHFEATLQFSGEAGNVTLVRDGAEVGNDAADYAGRVKVSSGGITIYSVNTSDVGRYMLFDRKDRLVSVTKMRLVEAHENTGNPLLALLLLLGIPAGVCCCCRKKIFRKKATTTATQVIQASDPPPGGPPSYNTPLTPVVPPGPGGQVFYHGPTPDNNAAYAPGCPASGSPLPPPQNPAYPGQPGMPAGPGFQPGYGPQNPLYPPAPGPGTAPQWSGPPPNQYNPAVAPGYAPVAYSAAPPTYSEKPKEEIQMDSVSPAAALLPQDGQAAAPPLPTNVLSESDTDPHFKIDMGSKANFL